MGGGHHITPPKVPDFRIYKVDDCPQLVTTRNMLAQHGLKDPWLRNEVWRYPPSTQVPEIAWVKEVFTRRIRLGFGLAVLTILGEKVYHHFYPEDDHHH